MCYTINTIFNFFVPASTKEHPLLRPSWCVDVAVIFLRTGAGFPLPVLALCCSCQCWHSPCADEHPTEVQSGLFVNTAAAALLVLADAAWGGEGLLQDVCPVEG